MPDRRGEPCGPGSDHIRGIAAGRSSRMEYAHHLQRLVQKQKNGVSEGICSVCSSSPFVIDAAIIQAVRTGTPVLIEATANQVNQMGGYTGMKPADFRDYVLGRAAALGLPAERLILGGDHLGPVAWQKRDSAEAMDMAEELTYEFAKAGFTKIHLDASMPLGSEVTLTTEEIADRTVRLCKASERGFEEYRKQNVDALAPVYVIGSEVPTPGGSGEEDALSVTKPEALKEMLACFEEKFTAAGLADGEVGPWSRIIAAVVQPGVEFGNDNVHEYVPEEAVQLTEEAKHNTQWKRQYMEWERQRTYDFENGKEAGKLEGAQQKAIEDARSFYANGASIELIANSLKMTIEQVKEIVKDVVQVKVEA